MAQHQVTLKKILPEKTHQYYNSTGFKGQCDDCHCPNQQLSKKPSDDSMCDDISGHSKNFCNSQKPGKFNDFEVSKQSNSSQLPSMNRHSWTKTSIDAPAPLHYQLKDKRQRHVYHTITVSQSTLKSCVDGDLSIPRNSRPAIPYKPHYLRPEYMNHLLPVVPPKIKNTEAVVKRQQLTEEYFENILRNVDNEPICHSDIISRHNGINSDGAEASCSWSSDGGVNNVPLSQHPLSTSLTDNAKTQDLTYSLKLLKSCGWYWGEMTWKEAELMLQQKPGEIGLFLLRDSQDPLHILTVTVRTDVETIRHIRVEYTNGKFQLYEPSRGTSRGAANCVRHSNIITFVKMAMKHSRNGNFLYFVRPRGMGEIPIQIQLLSPISRFSCVKSLKYYCRFVIRNQVPREDVSSLPVPHQVRRYLMKPYYFDLDEDLECALRA